MRWYVTRPHKYMNIFLCAYINIYMSIISNNILMYASTYLARHFFYNSTLPTLSQHTEWRSVKVSSVPPPPPQKLLCCERPAHPNPSLQTTSIQMALGIAQIDSKLLGVMVENLHWNQVEHLSSFKVAVGIWWRLCHVLSLPFHCEAFLLWGVYSCIHAKLLLAHTTHSRPTSSVLDVKMEVDIDFLSSCRRNYIELTRLSHV